MKILNFEVQDGGNVCKTLKYIGLQLKFGY